MLISLITRTVLKWSRRAAAFALVAMILMHLCTVDCAARRKKSPSTSTRKKKVFDNEPALKTSAASSDPFEDFAGYLRNIGKESGYDNYELNEVRRAVKKLASGQSAIKTMDGAAHRFRTAFSDSSSSLGARFKKFMSGDQNDMKEAGKLFEYVTTVERSLQAAEVLSGVGDNDDEARARWMKLAGLQELKRVTICRNKMKCILSIMAPVKPVKEDDKVVLVDEDRNTAATDEDSSSKGNRKKKVRGPTDSMNDDDENTATAVAAEEDVEFEEELRRLQARNQNTRAKYEEEQRFAHGELVIALVDGDDDHSSNVKQLLKVMSQKPEYLSLSSVGLVQEDLTIQPTFLELCVDALEEVKDYILQQPAPVQPAVQASIGNTTAIPDDTSTEKLSAASTSSGEDDDGSGSSSNPAPPSLSSPSISMISHGGEEDAATVPAAVVAAAEAERLNVTLNGRPLPSRIRVLGHSAGGAVGAYMSMVLEGFLNSSANSVVRSLKPFVGTYSKRIHCYTLGPPPCVSRAVVPRFITSVLCGDDVIPRASPDALEHVSGRVLKALKAGAGRGSIGWMVGAGWLSDLGDVAGKSLGQYASGSHDLSALSVPGRAFYIKSRQHKKGASIQRVLRGQWREDILWLLHEVLLSRRMIEHHSIDSHVKTLMRC